MKKTSLFVIACAGALIAGQALAQSAAPAAATAAPTPPTFGAAVPGQCVLDEQSAMSTSAMGKAASDRLVQLKAQVDAELSAEGKAIEDEYKALTASQKTSSATPAGKTAWEGKAQAWEGKRQAFQAKVQQRNQEMQYTQQEVMQAIFSKMIPQINAVVTQKACATVLSADSLLHYESSANTNGGSTQTSFLYANPAMNITSAVVQKMDASGELLPTFNRVSLDQPAAGAGAAPKK
ncbi:OmpH family outer membrane protein [Asticcacaulis sp. 201]|uniref:OmpH family outer membrane protein n=1 Tax=Asticcacaulis sp. 201 TaxID=3028787 RepID=UPI002916FD4C|nr:OmpH family outer membrane protein [Asticcacaulis sp. 201]MDV6329316.1 OmpH family outer membrane protein [Asticcacaulis sp. 201]